MVSAFTRLAEEFTTIEFGIRFILPKSKVFEFKSTPQPSFNKNFELLAQDLFQHQLQGFQNFITADVPKQTERLKGIFDEINDRGCISTS